MERTIDTKFKPGDIAYVVLYSQFGDDRIQKVKVTSVTENDNGHFTYKAIETTKCHTPPQPRLRTTEELFPTKVEAVGDLLIHTALECKCNIISAEVQSKLKKTDPSTVYIRDGNTSSKL